MCGRGVDWSLAHEGGVSNHSTGADVSGDNAPGAAAIPGAASGVGCRRAQLLLLMCCARSPHPPELKQIAAIHQQQLPRRVNRLKYSLLLPHACCPVPPALCTTPLCSGGRTIIPGVTPVSASNANAEDTSTGAGSGLGSLVDMSGGSGISSPSHDPFSITSSANMNGAQGVLGGGTSASAMAGFGSGGAPSSGLASRRNRVTSSSSNYKASSGLVGAVLLIALLAI